jgi:3-oxoacyl-[acyl-carrier protein] reductase
MTDKYAQLVNHGLGRNVARKLGLPQPAVLRRYQAGQPLITGPVVVQGDTPSADGLAAELLSWDLDVRRHAVPREKLGAIILVLDEVARPEDLAKPILAAAASLRDLGPGGRFITVSRPASDAASPAQAAARQGVDGFPALPGQGTARRSHRKRCTPGAGSGDNKPHHVGGRPVLPLRPVRLRGRPVRDGVDDRR